eukprot:SAG11_NODE_4653_length_1820_cov_1.856479_1_plen_221_part_00
MCAESAALRLQRAPELGCRRQLSRAAAALPGVQSGRGLRSTHQDHAGAARLYRAPHRRIPARLRLPRRFGEQPPLSAFLPLFSRKGCSGRGTLACERGAAAGVLCCMLRAACRSICARDIAIIPSWNRSSQIKIVGRIRLSDLIKSSYPSTPPPVRCTREVASNASYLAAKPLTPHSPARTTRSEADLRADKRNPILHGTRHGPFGHDILRVGYSHTSTL